MSDEQVAEIVECPWKLFPLGLFVILDGVFRMRLDDILIFLFIENSLLIDIPEVSDRIQMLLLCCFLVVVNSTAYLSLSIGVKAVELLLEVEQALLQELSNTVKSLRISLLS